MQVLGEIAVANELCRVILNSIAGDGINTEMNTNIMKNNI